MATAATAEPKCANPDNGIATRRCRAAANKASIWSTIFRIEVPLAKAASTKCGASSRVGVHPDIIMTGSVGLQCLSSAASSAPFIPGIS